MTFRKELSMLKSAIIKKNLTKSLPLFVPLTVTSPHYTSIFHQHILRKLSSVKTHVRRENERFKLTKLTKVPIE